MLRFLKIISIFILYFLLFPLAHFKIYKKPKSKLLRNFFEELGGSFIKFGQILSMRVDMLPPAYSLELLDMLDHVKPISTGEVRAIFKRELGVFPEEIFSTFDKNPLASASFGQVHRATVEGEEIAVKIMRPGIDQEVKVDFIFIHLLAHLADIFYQVDSMPWIDSAREFKRWTLLELDYHNEAENAEKIRLKHKNENVIIPKVYYRYSTSRILVQEFINGISLSDVFRGLKTGTITAEELLEEGIDIKRTPEILAEEFLMQYFFTGFYHADPHPGNIILLPGNKIGLVDFGILGTAIPNQKALVKLFKAVSDFDYKTACYYLINFAGGELKQLAESAFPASITEEEIENFLKTLADQFYGEVQSRIDVGLERMREVKTDHIALMLQFSRDAATYRIKFPTEMVAWFRSLSILGFLSKQLDKEFKMSTQLKAFFEKYPEESFLENSSVIHVQRVSQEVAMQRLADWMSFLFDRDYALYKVVTQYVQRYDLLKLH